MRSAPDHWTEAAKRWQADGVPAEECSAFLEKLAESPTMRRLAQGNLDDRMRHLLAGMALADALLDPVGRAVDHLAALEERERLAEADRRRDELVRAGLDADLADEARARLLAAAKRRRPGRKRSPAGKAVYLLEYAISFDRGLPVRARRRLIAELVSEFVEPTTAERVRLLVKDARQRDRAQRRRGKPLAAILTATESAMLTAGIAPDRSLEEREAARHFSGAAGWLREPDSKNR